MEKYEEALKSVQLYQSTTAHRVHTTLECLALEGRDTLPTTLYDVLERDLGGGTYSRTPSSLYAICMAPTCARMLDTDEVHLAYKSVELLRACRSIDVSIDEPIDTLAKLSEAYGRIKGRYGDLRGAHPTLQEMEEALTLELRLLHGRHLQEMRTPQWRERLHDVTHKEMQEAGMGDRLQEGDMGDLGDLGLMVGPSRVRDAGTGYLPDEILQVLKDDDAEESGTCVTVAPLSTLVWVADTTTPHNKTLGDRRKVIRAPLDLDDEMQETILGLYDPDSTGPLGDLHSVVEAARRVRDPGRRARV